MSSPRDYYGAPRVPHNLTGNGTTYAEWLRELEARPVGLRWDRLALGFAATAAWFLLGWLAFALVN
ncbi:hypothetical protein Kuura_053 [Caulobacter phage Kuura]|nr:hypothetical protein Kuura_053 [Caulobacter phage Kuura]